LILEIDAISVTERRHFFGTLLKAQSGLDRYLESFRALLGANVERVLGVKMAPNSWKIEVAEPARPDISIGHVFDFHFDLLWFLIPMFLFRPLFERHFLRLISRQVQVNFSRLSTQWEMRINRAIEDMRRQAAQYIRDEVATIDALLSHSEGKSDFIQQSINALEGQWQQMNPIQQAMKGADGLTTRSRPSRPWKSSIHGGIRLYAPMSSFTAVLCPRLPFLPGPLPEKTRR
jgi:hypothetical protein